MPETILNQGDIPFYPEGAAVVIGGSGGIGRQICLRLAEHGANVALTYRSNARLAEEVADEILAQGCQSFAASLDLSDEASVASYFDEVHKQFGRIHTVIVATGADISMHYVGQVEPEEWRSVIDGDLSGFFYVCKAALPLLREGGGGSIVAMTSSGNIRHPQCDILSTAPKAGIEALVRGIAREEGRFGIRANSVALGVIEVGLFHRLTEQVSTEFVSAMKSNAALNRLGTAREAADAAVFLSCSSSSFISGACLAVDGGFSV